MSRSRFACCFSWFDVTLLTGRWLHNPRYGPFTLVSNGADATCGVAGA